MTETVHTIAEAAIILRAPYRVVRDAVFQGRWPHVKLSERKRVMTDGNIAEVLAMLRQEPSVPVSPQDARAMKEHVKRLLGG